MSKILLKSTKHQGLSNIVEQCQYKVVMVSNVCCVCMMTYVFVDTGLDRLIHNYQEHAQGLPTHLTLFCKCKTPPDEQRYSGATNLLHRAVLESEHHDHIYITLSVNSESHDHIYITLSVTSENHDHIYITLSVTIERHDHIYITLSVTSERRDHIYITLSVTSESHDHFYITL